MTPGQMSLADALEDVNTGMADTARATSGDWWSRASRAVEQLAREGKPFQAYDIVDRFGIEEPDNGAKQWGALFAASRRPTANASACREWIGIRGGGA